MMRAAIIGILLALPTAGLAAQQPAAPEACLAKTDDPRAVQITYGETSYTLASEACREQFLSDPERYSQLYDALLELADEGIPLRPSAPSLVPS